MGNLRLSLAICLALAWPTAASGDANHALPSHPRISTTTSRRVPASASAATETPRPPRALPALDGVTSYTHMTAFLRDAATHEGVSLASLGMAASGKRHLWIVRLATPGMPDTNRTRVLILCRQHGDEPAPTEAALRLIRSYALGKDRTFRDDLRNVSFFLVPMVNPDGADAGTRRNGRGIDLNRDWGPFTQPETRLVARAVARIQPVVLIDAHNWDGGDPYDAICLEGPRGNARNASHIRELRTDLIGALSHDGFSMNAVDYDAATDPTLAHRYFAGRGLLSMLIETQYGAPGDQADFMRRQQVYISLARALAHRYAMLTPPDVSRLDRLVGYHGSAVDTLFASDTARVRAPVVLPTPPPDRSPEPWLLLLGVYFVCVWGMQRRLPQPALPLPSRKREATRHGGKAFARSGQTSVFVWRSGPRRTPASKRRDAKSARENPVVGTKAERRAGRRAA